MAMAMAMACLRAIPAFFGSVTSSTPSFSCALARDGSTSAGSVTLREKLPSAVARPLAVAPFPSRSCRRGATPSLHAAAVALRRVTWYSYRSSGSTPPKSGWSNMTPMPSGWL